MCRIQWRPEKEKYVLWIAEARRQTIKKRSYTVTFYTSVPALGPEVTFVPGKLPSCPLHVHESHVDSKQWPSNFRKLGILCSHLISFHTDARASHSSLLPPPAPVLLLSLPLLCSNSTGCSPSHFCSMSTSP